MEKEKKFKPSQRLIFMVSRGRLGMQYEKKNVDSGGEGEPLRIFRKKKSFLLTGKGRIIDQHVHWSLESGNHDLHIATIGRSS